MKKINSYKNLFCKYTGYELESIVEFRQLLGGMSNLIFYVETKDDKFTFRIPFPESSKFVDFFIEDKALKLLKNDNITPLVIYYDELTGEKIAKYIEGDVLSFGYNQDQLVLVSNKLKQLHGLKEKIPYRYDYDITLEKYELLVDDIQDRYFVLKKIWIGKYFSEHYFEQKVFSHGDIQRSNIVYSKEENDVYLLDFEFSRLNTIFYDIATFGNNDFNDALELTKVYFSEKNDITREIYNVKFYRIYQALQWYLVASAKANTKMGKKLKLDFSLIANNYLDEAWNISKELKLDDSQ